VLNEQIILLEAYKEKAAIKDLPVTKRGKRANLKKKKKTDEDYINLTVFKRIKSLILY
jgi:hypothetical protein